MSSNMGLSLFRSLMIGSDLENAVQELREGIAEQNDPAQFAARVAQKHNINVRELITTYQENLSERENLREAEIDDAVADVEAEGEDALPEIAQEYGLSTAALQNAYRRHMERKPAVQRGEEQRRKEQQKAANRSEGAKKAYVTKVANMVDKVAREHKIPGTEAAEYVAQRLNISEEKVDQLYMQARGKFPPTSVPKAAPKMNLPKTLPQNAPAMATGRNVYETIEKIVNELGISEEDAMYYWSSKSQIDDEDIAEWFKKYTGHEPSPQFDKVQGLTELQKENVVQIMNDSVADQFPDGDPISVYKGRLEGRYGEDVARAAERIFKEVNGQDFHDHLADMWEDFANDMGWDDERNPWR